ncbi:MAG: peroxiredoxin [Phycisphaerales bacterium]|nr:peroxiredoxin [Phycisphaerales bacterium]
MTILLTIISTPLLAHEAHATTESTEEQVSIQVGQPAPAFTRTDQHGQEVSLSEFKGKWVVLYFYPKADTSGCTMQACDFSDGIEKFTELSAVILGMSPDSVEDQKKFAEKHKLKITLLSDTDKQVMRIYQAIKDQNRPVRSTVIIDPQGNVAHHWPTVTPRGHADMIRKKLDELRAANEKPE